MSKPRWSAEPPTRVGHYWHRYSPDHEATVMRVYKDDAGAWSVQYGDLDMDVDHENARTNWIVNMRGEWSRIPMPE